MYKLTVQLRITIELALTLSVVNIIIKQKQIYLNLVQPWPYQ